MPGLFDDPLQVLDYVHNFLTDEAAQIGLAHVGYAEERLIPAYPAIIVSAGPVAREIHGTHTFQETYMLELWVYHAKLSASHQQRTREDLEFVGAIRKLLHGNLRLYADPENNTDPQIVYGWVSAEDPAFISRGKGEGVVGSRLEWTGISQSRFK
jgi:hypothetical protein